MCIIAVKWADVSAPKDVLATCFENNPDGAGYMWEDGGKVHVRKGFFDFEELWKDYEPRNLLNRNVVFHFRIASSGNVDVNNCHPFPVTPDVKKYLKYRTLESGVPCLCHNGVISELSFAGSKYSDTVLFTEKLSKAKDCYRKENFPAGFNRFALLNPEGSVNLYGEGWQKAYGMEFSNGTYEDRWGKWRTSSSKSGILDEDPYAFADLCPLCHEYMTDLYINDKIYWHCETCGSLYTEDHRLCVPIRADEYIRLKEQEEKL